MNERELVRAEIEVLGVLERQIRDELYSLSGGLVRARAVTALAGAAAERAYSRSDKLPQWTNDTSSTWRGHLREVWTYLAGDESMYVSLSGTIATFLTSPLNHTDGQDGPDDFDRPQTIASYSAVASAVFWGVDFATTAVAQVFELIDCEYDGEMSPSRALEVERERDWAAGACKRIIASDLGRDEGLHPDLIDSFRH